MGIGNYYWVFVNNNLVIFGYLGKYGGKYGGIFNSSRLGGSILG